MSNIHKIKCALGQYERIIADKEAIQNTCISTDLKVTAYKDLQLRCDEIKNKLLELVKELPDVSFVTKPVIISSMKKDTQSERNSQIVVDNTSEKKWKEDISIKVQEIYNRQLTYVGSKEVLKELYEYMTNVYGIVWEQDFKEWRREHTGIPKTLEIIFNNEQYKSIFDSILFDKYNKVMEKEKISIKEIIEPLVIRYSDKSNGGCATLKKIYLHMENNYNIDWDKHMKKYYKENGTHAKTKSELLYWNHGLIERFRMSVYELMEN